MTMVYTVCVLVEEFGRKSQKIGGDLVKPAFRGYVGELFKSLGSEEKDGSYPSLHLSGPPVGKLTYCQELQKEERLDKVDGTSEEDGSL